MLFQPWSAFSAYQLRAWSDFSANRITCHNSVPSQYVQVVHTKKRQVPLIGVVVVFFTLTDRARRVVRTKVAPFFHMHIRSIMLFRSWSHAYQLGAWPDFNTFRLYALR